MVLLCAGFTTGDHLHFYAFGDWGGMPIYPYVTIAQEVCSHQMGENAKEFKPEFVLAIGDNFYDDGVKNVHDPRFKNTFEDVYDQESLMVPWHVVAGNHDWRGNVSAEVAYSNISKHGRWHFPSYFYTTTHTLPNTNITVEIVMIDTIVLAPSSWDEPVPYPAELLAPGHEKMRASSWQWVTDAIRNSKADWLFVAGHYPVWSVAEHGPTEALVKQLKPLLEANGVAVYFNGHEHNWQHLTDGSSVDYIVTGTGHSQEYSRAHAKDMPNNVKLEYFWPGKLDVIPMGAFTRLSVHDRDTMKVEIVLGDGSVAYSFDKSNPRS